MRRRRGSRTAAMIIGTHSGDRLIEIVSFILRLIGYTVSLYLSFAWYPVSILHYSHKGMDGLCLPP